MIEGNILNFDVFEVVLELYVVFVINNVSVIIKNNIYKEFKNYLIYCFISVKILIIGNYFERFLFLVIIYINVGVYEIFDNIILVNRIVGNLIVIYINGFVGFIIFGNIIDNFFVGMVIVI